VCSRWCRAIIPVVIPVITADYPAIPTTTLITRGMDTTLRNILG